MNDKETRILEEPQTLLNLGSAYTKAREEYLSELARDCERSDGSGVQEARRDVHQNELREAERSAESAPNAQKQLVTRLTEEYLSR
ncbi:hypothetical protein GTPT_2553 [Tatumella ptyseos ATCC 33301]|uniref:Uncharacterized protein n=1 Tax=Tatumella ptyseos ATCC 33301 TaxID=1005995 RepID=A0A085JD17_9GAMM|nr:hypothetical protein [Tatumella ptyseos]KFD18363.1 hypothetical protein GTPT_2553 [Tatumella ptyseos ATCC 33301]